MPLVDDEGLAEARGVEFIGAEQVDEADIPGRGAVEDGRRVPPAIAGHEAQIQSAHPRRRVVQHVEAVPAGRGIDQATALGDPPRGVQDGATIRAGQRAHAEDQHRPLGLPQNLRELVAPVGDRVEQPRIIAEVPAAIGEIDHLAHQPNREPAHQPALAQARVDQRRLDARIGADQQAGIGSLDAGDGGVEQIAGAR